MHNPVKVTFGKCSLKILLVHIHICSWLTAGLKLVRCNAKVTLLCYI